MKPFTEPPRYNSNRTVLSSPKNGLIAFEFEMEGTGVHPGLVDGRSDWTGKSDGSLRGDSAEFVTTGVHTEDRWRRALSFLDDSLADVEINNSDRCSTHVHLNVSNFTIPQVANMCFLWYLVEDFMVDYCDDNRKGNLFALRLQDADSLLSPMLEYFQTGRRDAASYRYAAMNFDALFRYGSLEFRSHGPVNAPSEIIPWAEMLLELRQVALNYSHPLEIVQEFSAMSPAGFISRCLPLIWSRTIENATDIEERLYGGVRRVQDLAYFIRWDELSTDQPETSEDPSAEAYRRAVQAHERAFRSRRPRVSATITGDWSI